AGWRTRFHSDQATCGPSGGAAAQSPSSELLEACREDQPPAPTEGRPSRRIRTSFPVHCSTGLAQLLSRVVWAAGAFSALSEEEDRADLVGASVEHGSIDQEGCLWQRQLG